MNDITIVIILIDRLVTKLLQSYSDYFHDYFG